MKLKQIKEFTAENITQEFAAQISSLTIWNHYKDKDYRDRGFTVVNGIPKGIKSGGSCYPWSDDDEKRGYIKTPTGVEITTCLNDTVRIFKNGNVISRWRENDHGEYDYITRNKHTGDESKSWHTICISNQVEIVQLYLDHGFFTIE